MTPLERALAKVEQGEGCWEWRGHIDWNGYAALRVEGRTVGAHRVVYEGMIGPIPEGLELDHLCFVKHCVNPDHLEPVTHRENMQRSARHRARE